MPIAATQELEPMATSEPASCRHCKLPCLDGSWRAGEFDFCCAGCRAVYSILTENGLGRFYELDDAPGVRPLPAAAGVYDYLDDDALRRTMLDFTDGRTSRVTFNIPAIHCIACVWLLENLFRLRDGIGRSQVDFPRKSVSIAFDAALKLSELVRFLASLGYEPLLKLRDAKTKQRDPAAHRLYLQMGVAGFAFGNIMMMSFPSYLGLDVRADAALIRLFGWLSLALAAPVLLFSAADYWRAAWTCLRERILTIELPIAVGIGALFAQSAAGVFRGAGPGYLDSFTGLMFFLLCGRWFQRKTWETLSFDRDYTSYFPLSVMRRENGLDQAIPLQRLKIGDRIVVRNQELVPADAILRSGDGFIDYSFVTGESEPVACAAGDYIYAGGRQAGGAIELETVKDVSHSYLTSLWNSDAFQKEDRRDLANLTNTAGRYFTFGVLAFAGATLLFWLAHDAPVAVRAFSAVLLVACPCALALSAPFSLGSAVRLLGRSRFFFRNGAALERMARIDTIVFDKTGTLTLPSTSRIEFRGRTLSPDEQRWIHAVAAQSTHPHSRHIADALSASPLLRRTETADTTTDVVETAVPAVGQRLTAFNETPGQGVEATVEGHRIRLGSAAWCEDRRMIDDPSASAVHVALDERPLGIFVVRQSYRECVGGLRKAIGGRFRFVVLSGDNDRERANLAAALGPDAQLHFGQGPHDKLQYIRDLQADGRKVMMIGDGLNDAGALKQSDVGVAVSEDTASFSPACDVIMEASQLGRLGDALSFSRATVRIILASFGISLFYNAIGISLAASGRLSPMIAAVLMPASSFSVIGFTLIATRVAAKLRRMPS